MFIDAVRHAGAGHRRAGHRAVRAPRSTWRRGPSPAGASARSCASTTRPTTATCPSPMVLASAMAARTTTLPIMVAVVILPLYDPVRLAEEMVVLDIISGGRVSYVAAIGYRPVEYEMFGVDFHRRGQLADEKLAVLLRGQDRRAVRARRPPHPRHPGAGHARAGRWSSWGGGSAAAARRAGRFGLGFLAQGGGGELEAEYEAGGPGRRPRARASARPAGRRRRPPCSWPTTSTGRGTSSARTSCTTSELRGVERGQHPHGQPLVRRRRPRSCGPRAAATGSSRVDEAVEMVRGRAPLGAPPAHRRAPARDRLALPRDRHRQGHAALGLRDRNHPSEVTPRHGPSGHTLPEAAPRGERRGGPPCA